MSLRDYKVLKELGSGAFGTVVLVQKGGQKYCVKKVDVRRMPAKEREAAVKEAKVLKKFNHPNIVQYVDQFIEDFPVAGAFPVTSVFPSAEKVATQSVEHPPAG